MNTQKIEEALRFDALLHAEEITGKSYKTDGDTEMLGVALHMSHGQQKRTLLKNAGDAYWAMPMSEWVALVESMGFERIFSMAIPDTPDFFYMWWKPGILLKADTYNGPDGLNGAMAYFNYKGPRSAMFKCSSGHAGTVDGEEVWEGSVDAREGFRFAMDRMQAAGEFLPVWIGNPFLWLLHYMDTKKEGYSYEAINAERIALLPPHVQSAIKPESA